MRTGGAAALLLLLAAIVYVPIALPPAETEPDLSLRAMAHFAFVHHLQFGRDIVYTYGPWGILQQRGFDPRTNATVLFTSALLALAFAYGLFRIARDAGANAAMLAMIALAAAALLSGGGDDARFIALDLLLLLSIFVDAPSASRELPLVATVALLSLIKFSFLVISVFVVAVLVIRRRNAIAALVFVATFLIADLAAHQSLRYLGLMLQRGFQVTSGYAEAASLAAGISWTMSVAAIGAFAFIVVVAIVERDWLRTLAIAGALWLVLKIGVVRQDDTHIRMCGALLPFLILGYALLRCGKARREVRIGVAAGVIAVFLINGPTLVDAIAADAAWMRNRSARTEERQRDVGVRAEASLVPAVRGSIDAYPWGGAALIVRGLDYAPRPIFESYMAWTPALAELNAAHLRASPPEWLWTTVGTIDNRLPLLDDAPSWLEILQQYAIAQSARDHLLLRKRATPPRIERIPIAANEARLGETVNVPQRGAVWCAIAMRPTLVERFVAIAARPPAVYLDITAADGSRIRYRAPVAMLRGGFLISPAVRNVIDLAALLSGTSDKRVVAMRVVAESGYAREFRVSFSELKSGS